MRKSFQSDRWNSSESPWLAAIGILTVVYLVWFFSEPMHRTVAWFLLLPDQLIGEWMGGNWERVGWRERWPVFGVAIMILAAAGGWGDLLFRLLEGRADKPHGMGGKPGDSSAGWPWLERSVVAIGLGLVVISNVVLFIGLAGLLRQRLVAVLFCVAGSLWGLFAAGGGVRRRAVAGRSPARRDERASNGSAEDRCDRPSRWLIALLSGFVVGWSLYLLAGAVLPPYEFDVREYHLQVPKEWYQAGRIEFLPHNVYGNMPLGAEMPALLAMSLWGGADGWWYGALSGKCVMGAQSVLAAILLWCLARRYWGPMAGATAAFLYLGTPWVVRVSTTGFNEGVLAFYVVMALHALTHASWDAEGRRARRWIAVAAVSAGFTAGCKYPALLFVVVPVAAWSGLALRRSGERLSKQITMGLVVAASMTAAGSAWYVKNAAVADNPVYPLLGKWLDGRTRSPERIAQWERAHQVPRDASGHRFGPRQWRSAWFPILYRSHWANPLLVPLLLLALLSIWRDRRLAILGCWLLFAAGVWFLATHRIERFLVPMLPIAVLCGGVAVTWLWQSIGPARRALLAVFLVFGACYSTVASTSRLTGDNRILVSLAVLRDDVPHPDDPGMTRVRPVHRFVNRSIRWSPGDALLLIGDAQPFDLEMPVYYNTCFDATWLEVWFAGRASGEARRRELLRHGIRFVIVDWGEIDRYRRTYGYSSFITRSLVDDDLVRQGVWRRVPVSFDGGVELFEVTK